MKKKPLGILISDRLAQFAGSWTFIIIFCAALIAWIILNTEFTLVETFDPYPFILLNLFLSCIAAIQAPVILMAQNRQSKKDRKQSDEHYDLTIELKNKLEKIERMLIGED